MGWKLTGKRGLYWIYAKDKKGIELCKSIGTPKWEEGGAPASPAESGLCEKKVEMPASSIRNGGGEV